MGIFEKLFDNPEKRKLEKIIRDVEQKHRPIGNLALTILEGSFSCGEAMKPYLSAPTQAENDARYVMVCYEFIYFFSHLMNRFALAMLGNAGRIKLQNEIAPLIVMPAISGFFDHWPEDKKEKMIDHFYDDLNDAELDYSTCHDIMPSSINALFNNIFEGMESSSTTCLSKLISRIYTFSEKSLSNEALLMLFDVSTKTYINMKLKQHVEEIKKIINID